MSDFLLHGSYLAIILVLTLTGMGLPIPEEVVIIAAGVLSSHDQLNPWLAFGACLVGAVLGDCASYWIGFHFGRSFIRDHHWWNRFVTPEREQTMERMIQAHGFKMLFLARFLIGLRSTLYITAGILHVPFRRFILVDLACAAIIIGVFFGLSYQFGEVVTGWIRGAEWTVTAVVVAVLVAAAIFFWRRYRHRLLEEDDLSDTETEPETDQPSVPSPGESEQPEQIR